MIRVAAIGLGSRYAALLWLDLAVAISAGVWVNLMATRASSTGLLAAVSALGWANVWLALACLVVGIHIYLGRLWSKADQQRLAKVRAVLRFDILKVAVEGIRSLRANIRLNARYFRTEIHDGRLILRKDSSVHIETAHMPGEYGLNYAIVGVDDLGICRAYQQRAPIFQHLSGGEPYSPRIAHRIDPNQKWVLACPVLNPDELEGRPLGVICFYSTDTVVRNERDEVQLKQVAVAAATALGVMENPEILTR